MKKIFLLIALVLGIVAIFNLGKIKEALFAPDLPEPTAIPFEKQLPLYSYDWKIIGPVSGKAISFVEYMDRNVIVNYWSSKSPASVEELEVWAKLYEDYKNDIFFVFATNDSQVETNKFIKEKGYLFPVFLSASKPLRSSMVFDKAPKTYMISKNGRIAVNYSGAANWNSESFRKVLDEFVKNNK